jgi:hypothetical protein
MKKVALSETEVAGILHYEGRNRLEELYTGVDIDIVCQRQPENPHDTNAIEVYLADKRTEDWDQDAKKLGYLPAKQSEFFTPLMDHGGLRLTGEVTTYHVSGPGKHFINIRLWASFRWED